MMVMVKMMKASVMMLMVDNVVGGNDNEEDVSDAGNKVGSTTQPTADDDDCKQSILRFRFRHPCHDLCCHHKHDMISPLQWPFVLTILTFMAIFSTETPPFERVCPRTRVG